MTRRRFYAPPAAFAPDGAAVVLSAEESRHLRDVLRLRAGDEAFVFDGEGREFACVVAEAGGRRGGEARLGVRAPVEPQRPESPLELTLAVGLLKGEKFDLVVQKATELGVSRVVPVVTKRADVRLRDERDAAARAERWRRLALEAAKQSGRARVPAVETPAGFDAFISTEPRPRELRLLFSERGGAGLAAAAEAIPSPPAGARALVGPEGGWDEAELEAARARGWLLVTLGGRTLRAETAAVAVAALLQHRFGDLT
ncbi:MAG TPA: 16S rRNA (uracil(1498)-N(3))-methyltransferase [Pyrinomonadaceae bacterium]|nr:16S rRNA (uracil(1498)-N(3))-methyltransferase [Pyrinomonadaceae bacterium]